MFLYNTTPIILVPPSVLIVFGLHDVGRYNELASRSDSEHGHLDGAYGISYIGEFGIYSTVMSDQTMSAYKIVKTIVVCFAALIMVRL